MADAQWDPIRGAEVFNAWRKSDLPREGMKGTDVLDGMLVGGLKGEWLAASAGVVPFVSLPGFGKGILSIGGALTNPVKAWPDPALESLYLWIQRSMAALHGSVELARRDVIKLPVGALPGSAEAFYHGGLSLMPGKFSGPSSSGTGASSSGSSVSSWSSGSSVNKGIVKGMHGIGQIETGVLILIGVLGVAATAAAAWYAVRTSEKQVEVNGQNSRTLVANATLADIASAQLAKTGKVDPDVLGAISGLGKPPASSNDWTWAYVLGGGLVGVAGSVAVSEGLKRRRARR